MKRICLLVYVSIISLSAQAQFFPEYPLTVIDSVKLIVSYTLHWQQDSTNAKGIRSEDMLLFVGDELSKFQSKNAFIFDTTIRHVKSHERFQEMILDPARPLPFSGMMYRIYKNWPADTITVTEHTLDGTFKYQEPFDLLQWQLSGERDTINDYQAQMATTDFGGRSWVVWFSPEIPYSDGPYKFSGLPGLIVKAHDTRNHYVFELKTIEEPAFPMAIDFEEKEYIETTKAKFFKSKDAMYADIISRAKEAGINSSSQQVAARNAKKRNNPIELKRK